MIAQSAYFSLPSTSNDSYDALEVHTVAIFGDCAEQIPAGEEAPDGSICWSLYGHIPNQGLECISDFNGFTAACDAAEKMGGTFHC